MDELLGTTLSNGKYRIDSLVAETLQSRSYRGTHLGLQMPIFVKMLLHTADPRVVERFKAEAQRLARLNHPNVVRVYDFDREGEHCYLVSDFVQGRDLKAELKGAHGPLPAKQALPWIQQIGEALQHIHDRGIIHRDIKPGNILIEEAENRAVLCDFGLARMSEEAGLSVTGIGVSGTPAYMSPEQCLDLPLDARTDQFSFAVVVYEMLTGIHPFGGEKETSQTVRYKIIHDPAAPPSAANPALNAAVDAVLSQALSKDPEKRYPSVRAFVEALVAAMPSRAPAGEILRKLALPVVGVILVAAVALLAISFGPRVIAMLQSTPTPTFTATPSPSSTPTMTYSPTPTLTPTSTATPSPTATSTPEPTPTDTPEPTPTDTPPPTEAPTTAPPPTSTPAPPTATRPPVQQVTVTIKGLKPEELRDPAWDFRLIFYSSYIDKDHNQRVAELVVRDNCPDGTCTGPKGDAQWVEFWGNQKGNIPWYKKWTPLVNPIELGIGKETVFALSPVSVPGGNGGWGW